MIFILIILLHRVMVAIAFSLYILEKKGEAVIKHINQRTDSTGRSLVS